MSLSAAEANATHREIYHEHENDQEEEVRVSSELVRQVAGLLGEENEEALKGLLKNTFEIDDAAVSFLYSSQHTSCWPSFFSTRLYCGP